MSPRAATKFLSEHVQHEAQTPTSADRLLSTDDVHSVSGHLQSASFAANIYDIWAPASQDWTFQAYNLIARLGRLPENWDSYGANRVRSEAIQVAFAIISAVEPYGLDIPSITPSPTGGIQLGWYSDVGEELELEVEASGDVHTYFLDPVNESEWQGSVYDPQFMAYLRRMASNES